MVKRVSNHLPNEMTNSYSPSKQVKSQREFQIYHYVYFYLLGQVWDQILNPLRYRIQILDQAEVENEKTK